jgi:hypothetical protein
MAKQPPLIFLRGELLLSELSILIGRPLRRSEVRTALELAVAMAKQVNGLVILITRAGFLLLIVSILINRLLRHAEVRTVLELGAVMQMQMAMESQS